MACWKVGVGRLGILFHYGPKILCSLMISYGVKFAIYIYSIQMNKTTISSRIEFKKSTKLSNGFVQHHKSYC